MIYVLTSFFLTWLFTGDICIKTDIFVLTDSTFQYTSTMYIYRQFQTQTYANHKVLQGVEFKSLDSCSII